MLLFYIIMSAVIYEACVSTLFRKRRYEACKLTKSESTLQVFQRTHGSGVSLNYWVGNKVISFFFRDFQSKFINTNNRH